MSRIKHGDTLIEVVFSFMVFATVSVASIGIMNSGLNQAQRSLEITMARNELDSQAEALRFLQNNFAAEREFSEDQKQFTALWKEVTENKGIDSKKMWKIYGGDINDIQYRGCDDVYKKQVHITNSPAFVINTRLIQPKNVAGSNERYQELIKMIVIPEDKHNTIDREKILRAPQLYPRFIYTSIANLTSRLTL